MLEIDQEVLCNYCKNHYDSNMDNCEGSQCENITETYLDELGIIEDDLNKKTFGKLNVGAEIYLLVHEPVIPSIKKLKINSISQMNDDPLHIHYESTGINIPNDKINSSSSQNLFLYRKACQEKLGELCIKRIISLSRVIGSEK